MRHGQQRQRIRTVLSWLLAAGCWLRATGVQAAISAEPLTVVPVGAKVTEQKPSVSAPPATALQQRVSASFREVDFEAAIKFLAESGGGTIVLSPKAKGLAKPVSLHLVNIPLQHALDDLVRGQGLVYRFDRDAILVATLQEMEAEPLQTRAFFLSQGPGLFTDFEPLAETRDSVALPSAGIRRMTTIEDVLTQVVPKVGSSAVMLDERTGALIVTQVPYYMQQVERLLQDLDIRPVQVRIEARFIELTMTDTDEWSLDGQLTGNAALTKKGQGDGTQGPGLQLSSLGTSLKRGTGIDFTSFTNQIAGNGLNFTLQGILSGTQYAAVLHALDETKKTKTLSAPQVTTLNNQTATIKIVTEFVYATRYEASVKREDLNGDGDFSDVVNGVRETRFVNVPQDFVTKDLGILLYVTPSVGHDLKTITLALKPEVSEKKADDTFSGEVTLPRFTTRNLETTIVVEDGETVVLGGLMKDTTSKTTTKVPVLGDLPLLGPLFQKRADSVEQSNLLIFVTANLVTPPDSGLLPTASP